MTIRCRSHDCHVMSSPCLGCSASAKPKVIERDNVAMLNRGVMEVEGRGEGRGGERGGEGKGGKGRGRGDGRGGREGEGERGGEGRKGRVEQFINCKSVTQSLTMSCTPHLKRCTRNWYTSHTSCTHQIT